MIIILCFLLSEILTRKPLFLLKEIATLTLGLVFYTVYKLSTGSLEIPKYEL